MYDVERAYGKHVEECLIWNIDALQIYDAMSFSGKDSSGDPINPFPYVSLQIRKSPMTMEILLHKEEIQELVTVFSEWLELDIVKELK